MVNNYLKKEEKVDTFYRAIVDEIVDRYFEEDLVGMVDKQELGDIPEEMVDDHLKCIG